MKIGLFIPCYIDQLYPEVGIATLTLLEKLGLEVEFPSEQTCCGQPMANSGCLSEAGVLANRFLRVFEGYETIVCPSGSCVSMVRHHYEEIVDDQAGWNHLRSRVFELSEFLVDRLKVESLDVSFPFRVGVHSSCHGLRELHLEQGTERVLPPFSKIKQLLRMVKEIEIVELNRPDECCGFGGTFAVGEEAVSCRMGRDRIEDHGKSGAEVIVSADMSCLMHLEGLIRRDGKPIRVAHLAQVLAGMAEVNG